MRKEASRGCVIQSKSNRSCSLKSLESVNAKKKDGDNRSKNSFTYYECGEQGATKT